MNWIDKMERKFRGRGIPNLTVYVIICYVVGYLLSYMNPSMLSMMSLDVSKILQGQIWRLVTWVIYPPSTGNFFLFVISILFFYYPVGTSLERTWGSFRYTLYIFSGLLFVLIAAFITYFITGGFVVIDGMTYVIGGGVFTTYYVSLSVICDELSGYADFVMVCDSDQDEMDGRCVWCDYSVQHDLLYPCRIMGNGSTDCCITA